MTPTAARKKLYGLLGPLPPRKRRVRVLARRVETRRDFEIERLTLDLSGADPVPALFIKPRGARGPLPTVLFHHSHGGRYGVGKDEVLTGAPYLAKPSYARALTEAGFAVLAIDHWNFGARHTRTETSLFKELLWSGKVLWGQMVYDALRATDYLTTRPDVDAKRLGVLGMSMGATMAWWHAALDVRIKACVDLCCMTEFSALIESGGLDEHGVYYYVPGLLNHFDTAGINALIAPRAHLSLNGWRDPLTPRSGLKKIDRAMKAAYRAAPRNWEMANFDVAHQETARMRELAVGWMRKFLVSTS